MRDRLLAGMRPSGESSRANSDLRLSVEQVSYAYSPNPSQAPLFTLEATSFQARAGEIVAILGPNASGKSTLLKLIAGSLAPLSGRVLLNGFETHALTARTRAQRIAMVQQESPLLFPSRAWEFVLQGRHPHGRTLRFESATDVNIAKNALAQVAAAELSDRWMAELSGGEKQRVILARALAQQPLLLLLDEPTLHLDIAAQVDLLHGLRRLALENRYTVVVVTHELNLAAEYRGPGGADSTRQMFARGAARRGVPAGIAGTGFSNAAGCGDGFVGAAACACRVRQARRSISFAVRCIFAPRRCCRGIYVTPSGLGPMTITADFVLGKTVS